MLFRIIIITSILFAFFCSILYANKKKDGMRVVCVFLSINLLSECIAFYMAAEYRNNMPVFHFFSPISFLLIAIYLSHISVINKKYNLGLILGMTAISISILNTILFQPINTFNSNYLLLEGLFVCILGFIALFDYERDDKQLYPHKNPNFWMTVLLVFKQVIVFSLYIVIQLFDRITVSDISEVAVKFTYNMLFAIGVIGYILMGAIFLFFSKYKNR